MPRRVPQRVPRRRLQREFRRQSRLPGHELHLTEPLERSNLLGDHRVPSGVLGQAEVVPVRFRHYVASARESRSSVLEVPPDVLLGRVPGTAADRAGRGTRPRQEARWAERRVRNSCGENTIASAPPPRRSPRSLSRDARLAAAIAPAPTPSPSMLYV